MIFNKLLNSLEMSDWNTLHHFDDKKFYSEIVPDFKTDGQLLKRYFNSELAKYILYGTDTTNEDRIAEILRFTKHLDKDFKTHEILFNIHKRKKGINETYTNFIKKFYEDEINFRKINGHIIEDINHILTLIIFSECAAFNPHLILGRNIFIGCVSANPKSIAQELISKFIYSELGSIFYSSRSDCNGFINWVTNEELQLLWLDKENVYPSNKNASKYYSDFCKFIEIALDNNLGVISGTNLNEQILKLIESPLPFKIDIKKTGLENVINYE